MDDIYLENSNVLELINKNFLINKKKITIENNITKDLNGILIIYAPWCTHCVLSKNMWENLADLFKYKFNIYALNTYNYREKNQNLVLPLNIKVYPTYKFVLKNGEIKEYKGGKNEDEIINFIMKNL